VHLARRDGEVDAVEGDDLAEVLADPARANGGWCRETRQFVSGLGM
jgi:hypothetical protein